MTAGNAIAQPTPDKIKILAHEQYDAPESLSPSMVDPDPLAQFRAWFTSVQGAVHEPEAMTLCTALRALRAARPVARPNEGFMSQLRAFERVTRLREAWRVREGTSETVIRPEIQRERVGDEY